MTFVGPTPTPPVKLDSTVSVTFNGTLVVPPVATRYRVLTLSPNTVDKSIDLPAFYVELRELPLAAAQALAKATHDAVMQAWTQLQPTTAATPRAPVAPASGWHAAAAADLAEEETRLNVAAAAAQRAGGRVSES